MLYLNFEAMISREHIRVEIYKAEYLKGQTRLKLKKTEST